MDIEVGDLVNFDLQVMRVVGKDPSMRTFTLRNPGGARQVVHQETVTLYASPSKEWILLVVPPASSLLVGLRLLQGRNILNLELYKDWIPSDPFKKGAPLFLNPKLKPLPGDILTLVYENGRMGKYTLPTTMQTLKEKKEDLLPKKKDIDSFSMGDDR